MNLRPVRDDFNTPTEYFLAYWKWQHEWESEWVANGCPMAQPDRSASVSASPEDTP